MRPKRHHHVRRRIFADANGGPLRVLPGQIEHLFHIGLASGRRLLVQPEREAVRRIYLRTNSRFSQQTRRDNLSSMVIPVPEYKFAEPGPFARGQFKARRRKRIAARVFFVFEIAQSKPVRHVRFEIADNAAPSEFSTQQFGKNLKVTWAVDKSRTRFSHTGQSDRHRVSIANRRPLKTRRAFNAVGLAEQLPNRDLRFARVIFPLGDRVRHRIVESKQSLLRSRKRCNSPKTFCSAKDRPSSVRRPIVCVMLENCPAILHYQHRTATPALGVFCSVRAIRWFDFGEGSRRRCKCGKQQSAVAASLCEA